MSEFEFVFSDGPSRGQRLPFPGATFMVGSAPDCLLKFDASAVQSRHAEVRVDENGAVWVKDLTGKRLVWVNGDAVDTAQLHPGGFVRFGRVELVLREVGLQSPSGTMATPTPFRSKPVSSTSERRGVSGVNDAIDSTALRRTPLDSGPALAGGEPTGANDQTHRGAALSPGTVIDGRYQVVGKLAAGGMGEVYKAEHVELGKTFAIKVMLPELSKDPEFVARFKREAIAASRIGQQNIVDISDFGRTADGRFYFVMEFLEGMTLASLVHRQGALPVERAVNISAQVARALAAAHAQGIVHRDLKPENVMVLQRPGQADLVKVLDFGVAKVGTGHGQGGATAVGMVVGTPQYMSPEQAKALPVDTRTDIYSLGLIIYELLAGRPTFTGETPSILMVKQVTEAPPPMQPGPLSALPAELEELVYVMLAKSPEQRPQMMTQVVEGLEAIWASVHFGETTSNEPRPPGARTSGSFPVAGGPARPPSGPQRAPSGPFPATGGTPRIPSGPYPATGGAPRIPSGSYPGSMRAPTGQQMAPSDAAFAGGMPEEQLAPPKRSMLPIAVGVGVLVVGGGLGAWVVLKDSSAQPQPQVTQLEPEKPKVVEPPKVDPGTAAPTKIKVTLKSVPEGADIYEGDVMLGHAPLPLSRDQGAVGDFKFVLKGYKSEAKKVGFVAEQDLVVTLEKERTAGPTPRRPSSTGLSDNPYGQEEDLKALPE